MRRPRLSNSSRRGRWSTRSLTPISLPGWASRTPEERGASNVLGSGDDRLLSSGQDDLYMHVVEVGVIQVALVVACHPRRQAPHPDLLPLGDDAAERP